MGNVNTNYTAAAVDVGSNYLKISIYNIDNTGSADIVDQAVKPTNIGRDTFSTGKISVDTIQKTCSDMKKFSEMMKEYKIKRCRAVSTSGIREATNRQYILQQIKLHTGINVEVINISQERFYVMKALKYKTFGMEFAKKDATLIVNITTGYVEVSLFDSGNLSFTEHVHIGSLRVKETLDSLRDGTLDFSDITEQYIESKLYFAKSNITKFKIKNFIALGGELHTMQKLAGEIYGEKYSGDNRMDRGIFKKLYKKVKKMSTDQFFFEYGIPKRKSHLLLPTVIIFHSFFNMTGAGSIYMPDVDLGLGIVYDIADHIFGFKRQESLINDILSSAQFISHKYRVNEAHADYVEKISTSIFTQTRRFHKLGEREKLYLQVSSRLHDVGNFIDISGHENQSYNIIISQDILGFSRRELSIIANTAKYHSSMVPSENDYGYFILDSRDRMIVSVLSAILKLSEALDASHLQKIQDIKLASSGNKLYFNIISGEDLTLEEWEFKKNSLFFEEVLGIKPVI